MMSKVPPFHANTADNSRCFQAATGMVLEHLLGATFDIDFLDRYTGRSNDYAYTWPIRFAVNAATDGLSVVYHDALNVEELSADPYGYLLREYGQEIADDQIRNSDVNALKEDCAQFSSREAIKKIYEMPRVEDLVRYIDLGYLVIANVNSKAMAGVEGYTGHFVVVYDVDPASSTIFLHNPGLPPEKAVKIKYEDFDRGWAYGSPRYRNIMAVR